MYIFNDNGYAGFKAEGIHEILETDIEISDEQYNRFFELQAQGKQFKIKNINGLTFEEIFEEYIPEPVPHEHSEVDKLKAENETMKQSIAELTVLVTSLVGGGA